MEIPDPSSDELLLVINPGKLAAEISTKTIDVIAETLESLGDTPVTCAQAAALVRSVSNRLDPNDTEDPT